MTDRETRPATAADSPARRLYQRRGFTLEREDAVDVFLVREPRPRYGWFGGESGVQVAGGASS